MCEESNKFVVPWHATASQTNPQIANLAIVAILAILAIFPKKMALKCFAVFTFLKVLQDAEV